CVEVNQAAYLFRMARTHRAKFLPGQRMTDQDRPVKVERCNHCQNIITQAISGVVYLGWRRNARGARPPASDAIDMIRSNEIGGELVEAVSMVVSASEQDQSSTGAAPVHDFKFDIILDCNELD